MIKVIKEDYVDDLYSNLEDEQLKKIIMQIDDGDLQRIILEIFKNKDFLNNDVSAGFLLGLMHCGKVSYDDLTYMRKQLGIRRAPMYNNRRG